MSFLSPSYLKGNSYLSGVDTGILADVDVVTRRDAILRALSTMSPQEQEAYALQVVGLLKALPAQARAEALATAKSLDRGTFDPRAATGLGANFFSQIGTIATGASGILSSFGIGGGLLNFANAAASTANTVVGVGQQTGVIPAPAPVYQQQDRQPQMVYQQPVQQPQVIYQQVASKPTDWTNIALIGGGIVGVGALVFLITKKKKK
jgi:hypothetical protein